MEFQPLKIGCQTGALFTLKAQEQREQYHVPRMIGVLTGAQTTYSTGEPETLWYLGSDPRIPRTFTRVDLHFRREPPASDGQWANEVWLAYNIRCYTGMRVYVLVDMVAIYDHQVNMAHHGTHIWSIGPWSTHEFGPRM